ncbi:MAG: HAMP domain-containing sensor histidine kinase [Rickettsiales bacterium]
MLCFLAFFVVLLVLRTLIYYGTVQEALREVRGIVEQEYSEVDSALGHNLTPRALNLISALLDNDEENLFIIAYFDPHGRKLEGNLDYIPHMPEKREKYYRLHMGGDEYLIRYHRYSEGGQFIIGYSLKHVRKIEQIVISRLFTDFLLSLAAAIFCSTLITLFITRKLRQVNHTCRILMEGDLSARVPVTGSHDEFDQLGENFNRMLGRINELIDNVRATSDNMAHDLRTPLNRHRLRLEHMLALPATPDNMRQPLSEAIAEIDRLRDLCDALLVISRAESRVEADHFSDIALSDILDDVLDFYLPLAEEKQVAITSHVSPGLHITGDRQLLTQAIANLLDNAIKFSPAKGSVMLKAVADNDTIILTIEDRGPGIPNAYHNKVKERFFRLEESRTTPGTGIGLSVVDAILKLHNAEMSFRDKQPGLGVEIRFKTT